MSNSGKICGAFTTIVGGALIGFGAFEFTQPRQNVGEACSAVGCHWVSEGQTKGLGIGLMAAGSVLALPGVVYFSFKGLALAAHGLKSMTQRVRSDPPPMPPEIGAELSTLA
jgi:hypothetical protein